MIHSPIRSLNEDQKRSETLIRSWQSKEVWTLTATERWLNDRPEEVRRWALRRHDIAPGMKVKALGMWMRARLPKNFAVVHARLAALSDDRARKTAQAEVILP